MTEDGVSDVKGDDDDQDAVDGFDDGIGKVLSVPEERVYRVHEDDASHQQQAGHDRVLNADDDPSHDRIRSE